MLYVDQVLEIWRKEIGYLEKATNSQLDDKTANAGSGNWTKYARDMYNAGFYNGPKNGYAWCAVMFDWCIFMACGNAEEAKKALCYSGPYGAGCKASVQYYKDAGSYIERGKGTPKPGDQIFFGDPAAHTGIVEKVESGTVYTIEGNSDNRVRRRFYALGSSSINGYGRPRYDGDFAPFPFVDVPEDKYYYDAVKWAYENGITAGTDETHFSPKKSCTRAETVTMLHKLWELISGKS